MTSAEQEQGNYFPRSCTPAREPGKSLHVTEDVKEERNKMRVIKKNNFDFHSIEL